MQFYQVSSDWIYSPVLLRIERNYGLLGIGFYWKVVAVLKRAEMLLSEQHLLSLRGRGLPWKEAAELLHHTPEIFMRDEQGLYLLSEDQRATGLHASPASTQTRTNVGTEAGTERRTDTGTETRTETRTEAGSAQVIIDNKREEKTRLEEKAQLEFSSFMEEHCPHLQLMAEPITFNQLKKLRKRYSIHEIRSVLCDMENKPGLEKNCRSCYETAVKWLDARNNKSV